MSERSLTAVTGRSPGDHVCWPFHGVDEYATAAGDYVAEGMRRRELVTYLHIDTTGFVHTVVSDAAQVAGLWDAGRTARDRTPPAPGRTVASTATADVDRMTRRAVDEGWTGLRLLTDVTDLVADAGGRSQWMRAEHRLDRYTRGHPITVLCGYDADDLSEEVVADAASLHPLTRGTPSPFALRVTDPDGSLALWGEVDGASADELHRAITFVGPELPAEVLVDVSELRFIDHTGLAACDAAAGEAGVTMTLAGASPLVRWIVGTLGLANVRTGAQA